MPKQVPTERRQLAELIDQAIALLEDELELGLVGLAVTRTAGNRAVDPSGSRATVTSRGRALGALEEEVTACTRCDLAKGRTQSVFARGDPSARLLLVGEGPGRDEDLQGLPFVGAAGKLLDRMIVAMGLRPEEVYICNVVKCRPPHNRTPLANEAAACLPFLARQIELVGPDMIVALGRCAANNLGCAPPVGPWRGIWREWHGIAVMPTYHPAYLLRSPEFKRTVWSDLQKVMHRLGLA